MDSDVTFFSYSVIMMSAKENLIIKKCIESLKLKFQKKMHELKVKYGGRKYYMKKGKAHTQRFDDFRMEIQILRQQFKTEIIDRFNIDPEWAENYLKRNFKYCRKNVRHGK